MNKDSNLGTLTVAFCLCFVCSIIVSGAATALKDRQNFNKALDIKKNILMAGGLVEKSANKEDILEAYKKVSVDLIDLSSGAAVKDTDVDSYDQNSALSDPTKYSVIPPDLDVAKIKKRENWSKVYKILDDSGAVTQIILPIRGKGLWSTLLGFLAITPDMTKAVGLGFYQHGETPGLGAEIDNPKWKAQFEGKTLFDETGAPALTVIKGKVKQDSENAKYQVDGLSGATITANGVAGLLEYWLGEQGFKPYLDRLKTQRNGIGG
jgi:Na+-transporting NADH:ubiquinone oxidoreductase subunit C